MDAGEPMDFKNGKNLQALEKMSSIFMMEKDNPVKQSAGDYMSVMTEIKTLMKKDTNLLLKPSV